MKKILIADDSSETRYLIEKELANLGYKTRTAADGASAVSNAIRFQPDLILLDIDMPGVSGLEALSKIRDYESMKRIPFIIVSSHREKEMVLSAINSGANDYIIKPFNMGVLLAKVSGWINTALEEQWKFLPLQQESALRLLKVNMTAAFDSASKGKGLPYQGLKDVCHAVVKTIEENGFSGVLRSVEDHNNTLFLHSLMAAIYMYLFSVSKGFGEEENLLNALGGLLHDIGSVKIADEILFKPGKLNSGEFEKIKLHVAHGMNILNDTQNVDQTVKDICQGHHERMDGTGYPRGIKAEEISVSGRMAAIVEAYTTLTIKNVYGELHEKKDALLKLRTPEGHLDPLLLEEFDDAVLCGFIPRPSPKLDSMPADSPQDEKKQTDEKPGLSDTRPDATGNKNQGTGPV